jgi:hypothetical protein
MMIVLTHDILTNHSRRLFVAGVRPRRSGLDYSARKDEGKLNREKEFRVPLNDAMLRVLGPRGSGPVFPGWSRNMAKNKPQKDANKFLPGYAAAGYHVHGFAVHSMNGRRSMREIFRGTLCSARWITRSAMQVRSLTIEMPRLNSDGRLWSVGQRSSVVERKIASILNPTDGGNVVPLRA